MRSRLIIMGTLASDPWAGMAWMTMQITAGLRRLGHDVYYFEVTSSWPYDPTRQSKVCNSDYALPHLIRVAESFGFGNRWAYRRSYSDKEWFGINQSKAEELLLHADAVLNIAGATDINTIEELKIGRLVYMGTDPGYYEIMFDKGDKVVRRTIEHHNDIVTYGENIGNPDCPIPPLPRLRSKMRQPILLDVWDGGPPSKKEFTTVSNWKQSGYDIEFRGEVYYWSKHLEFLKFIELPKRINEPIELATNIVQSKKTRQGVSELRKEEKLTNEDWDILISNGWRLVYAPSFTTDPWPYRDYIRSSRGEYTVAKDMNVRLRSGWFSERSACYLAAGRPVITQDTGFGKFLPTGEGLFSFNTMEEILAAFERIESDYDRHSKAARAIAAEYFRAETVLSKLIEDLGL